MRKIQLIFILLAFAFASFNSVSGQDIKYKKIKQATGTLKWKLEDTAGNLIKEGTVVDGDWRQSSAMLIDYLVLELSEEQEIETALIFLGDKGCPMLNINMQFYYEGKFYPGKKYGDRYVVEPTDWEDNGTRFGKGNKQIMIFETGAASCLYRSMMGCFINHIVLPEGEYSITVPIEDKYVFYILGGTDYNWEK
jgi:hypothetical protein